MIRFSEHVSERSVKRKISKAQIIEVIKHAEQIKESFRERKLRRKRFGAKILEVVTVTEGTKIIVDLLRITT